MYIPHFSVLHTIELKLPSKDAAWPFNTAKFYEKLAYDSEPSSGRIYKRRTVHNCSIQLSKVGEHYDIQKFVKFRTLRVRKYAVQKYDFCIFMVKFTTFCKTIVNKYISSIFSMCYCHIVKRLWWTVCFVQCH